MRSLISTVHLYWGYLLPSQLLYPLNLTIAAVLWRFVVSCPISNIITQIRSLGPNYSPNHSPNLTPNYSPNLPPNYCLLAFFSFLASSAFFLLLCVLRHWRERTAASKARHASDLIHPFLQNPSSSSASYGGGFDRHGQIDDLASLQTDPAGVKSSQIEREMPYFDAENGSAAESGDGYMISAPPAHLKTSDRDDDDDDDDDDGGHAIPSFHKSPSPSSPLPSLPSPSSPSSPSLPSPSSPSLPSSPGAASCTPSAPALSLLSGPYDAMGGQIEPYIWDGPARQSAAEAAPRGHGAVAVAVRRSQSDRGARCEAAEAEESAAAAAALLKSRGYRRSAKRRGNKLLRTRSEPPDLIRLRMSRSKPSLNTGSVRVGNRTSSVTNSNNYNNNSSYTRNKSKSRSGANPNATPSNSTIPRPTMNRPQERFLPWVANRNNNNNNNNNNNVVGRTMATFDRSNYPSSPMDRSYPSYPSSPIDSLTRHEANQVFSNFIFSFHSRQDTDSQNT